ncbi:MAG: tyrosine-type recombinase/integrase [Alphaproteobacteria bacterium]
MPEYNPVNELVKKQYEEALLHGKYRDPKTVRAVWNHINQFEESTGYMDFKAFSADQAKSFKMRLEKQKNKKGELLSISTVRSTLNNVREFFEWLAIHPQYVRKVDGRAVQYLRMSDNANRAARASREKTPPTLEEMEKALKALPHNTDIEKRDRAVFAFTIVTCVRDDALVSLKMGDVDAKKRTVWQNPKHVRTKRRKGIITKFVGQVIPLAEEIVLEWLQYAQGELKLKASDPLFPKTLVVTNPDSMAFEAQGLSKDHWASAQPVREIFKTAFKAVRLPYYNPHLFRKTVCRWGLKNLSSFEFKALSQNIGHEHAMTTYNSYAKISEDEQLEAIANIGQWNADLRNISTDEILAEMARRSFK